MGGSFCPVGWRVLKGHSTGKVDLEDIVSNIKTSHLGGR